MNKDEIDKYIDSFYDEAIYCGTKLSVNHIIDDLAKGMSFDEILNQHKQLSKMRLQATFAYIKIVMRNSERNKVFSLI
jgi:uncharacterized protein (DUF433 family)